ncbi:MAG: imidazole glycerol phosphate synthase subunit HisH [Alphaproteobacteria bacterium]|nr:imidazole glycerol phosphate synthase subunit HisH [Alphaproteobacteria bacterium]MCD8520523.1 imidazole glycerol phosphate synthase subunit HisH [Alphaproteobacteria bacterium]MCD8570635.1 imidazole glycerol phosphate synthase subunit HisH [Alphaproteobacteria bacterium]
MGKKIVIIDYGSGNLRSAAKAFEAVSDGVPVIVSSTAEDLDDASHIVLPGQGAFGDCMAGLTALPGMVAALEKNVRKQGKPFFGICVGMQLLADKGLEHGAHKGLGWISGEVVRMTPTDPALKIPHMGWNNIKAKPHPLFAGLAPDEHVYFVHSYHFAAKNAAHVLAWSEYGGNIAAAVGKDNIMGVQFHPEKSQAAGLTIIKNFIQLKA